MTPKALRLLQDLRRQLVHPPITPELITEAVTAAAEHRPGACAPSRLHRSWDATAARLLLPQCDSAVAQLRPSRRAAPIRPLRQSFGLHRGLRNHANAIARLGAEVYAGRVSARRVRIGVVLAAGLAVAASAPLAEATFPGRNGRIAFTNTEFFAEDSDYRSQIISIRPDGSAPHRLAGNKAEFPAYRPDGHMIAFARPTGIFLMRSDGSAERRLLRGPYGEPDWSPDGRRLIVTRTRKPRGIVIWSRGQLSALTSGTRPAWSPTGQLIAFTRADRPQPEGFSLDSVYVMRADGSGVRRLGLGFGPEWSPDGRRIIFTGGDNVLRSIRPDGTGLRAVAPIHGSNPVYAPNGRRIAYLKNFQRSGFRADAILTMGADGRRRTRIFDTAVDRYSGIYASELDWQPRPRRRP
jgi:TolB protein